MNQKELIEYRKKMNQEFLLKLSEDDNISIEAFRQIFEEISEHDHFVFTLIDNSYHGTNFREN